MNYVAIEECSKSWGDGERVVVWIAGRSKVNYNEITGSSQEITSKVKKRILKSVAEDNISGISFIGGDPLAHENMHDFTLLVHNLKKKHPKKTIWVWTEFYYDQICQLSIVDYIDMLICGPYVKTLKDDSNKWKTSLNQYMVKLYNDNRML